MADWNRVTEKPHPTGPTLWLVSAEWRGGHDKRVIRLHNIYTSESHAQSDWDRLTPERHNEQYGRDADYDAGFVRFPIRVFRETAPPQKG